MTHEPLEFAVSPNIIRNAIDRHKDWIESKLGIPLSDAVILKIDQCLAQAAIDPIVQFANENACDAMMVKRMRARLTSVEIPPYSAPIIALHHGSDDEIQRSHFKQPQEEVCPQLVGPPSRALFPWHGRTNDCDECLLLQWLPERLGEHGQVVDSTPDIHESRCNTP